MTIIHNNSGKPIEEFFYTNPKDDFRFDVGRIKFSVQGHSDVFQALIKLNRFINKGTISFEGKEKWNE